ncbi:MAG: serine hydrolase domain-containing protein [Gemmatimonadaceae bacterium]
MPRLLLLLLAFVISGPCRAADAQPATTWAAFSQSLRSYTERDGVVGATAILMEQGRITSQLLIGEQDRAAHRAVTPQTIYHWGSITKTLTAVSIMQLRDRGRLSLDDRITRYLPELRQLHDPYGMIDSITIRMLLSHSAGFRNGSWPYAQGLPWEPFEPTTWQQLVAMMPYQTLLFRPGSQYSYSNPAFIYLARVIEQLTGDPWEAYVQKNIFAPLGMTASSSRHTPFYLASDRSHNYTIVRDSASQRATLVENPTEFDPGITVPNGGWNAPVGDLARWIAFLTNTVPPDGSRAHYDVVLSRASLEEMWRPVVPMASGYEANAEQSMGLSFFVRGTGAERVIGHTGFQAGFRAFFYANPSTGRAVLLVLNTTNDANPESGRYEQVQGLAIKIAQGR